MVKKRLLIVSDSSMIKTEEGRILAFEPVVREVENFQHLFSQITWIGFNYNHIAYANNLREAKVANLKYILLPFAGGNTLLQKLKVLWYTPYYMIVILREMYRSDLVHTRAPSVPSFIAVVCSGLFKRKQFWHKYAGNWGDPKPSFFYGVQRNILQRITNAKITINGKWAGQRSNTLSFENPCISEQELEIARQQTLLKTFEGDLNLLFVGRIEKEKGIFIIIDALKKLDANEKRKIKKLRFVGNGESMELLKQEISGLGIECELMGSMNREALNEIYKLSHFLILPSYASEGFPKVVAEAAAFGCIPIVSNISSISQYIIHGKNGFVLEACNAQALYSTLTSILKKDELNSVSTSSKETAKLFTYERYNSRIKTELFNS